MEMIPKPTLFHLIDRDSNKSIDIQELSHFIRSTGADITEAQLIDLFSSFDKNNDGQLDQEEFSALLLQWTKALYKSESTLEKARHIKSDKMVAILDALKKRQVYHPEKQIQKVVLLVVVAEEIKPVFEKFKCTLNEPLTAEFLNLAIAFSTSISNSSASYDLTILQVSNSTLYKKHNSGYAQAAAIAALAAKIIKPDLLISFGTAGGITTKVEIGDAILGLGTVFVDRFRTANKNSFDWGVYGGATMLTSKIALDLKIQEGLMGSQGSYDLNDLQIELMDSLGVVCLDMECASEAQILDQTKTNFIALKMISNGIYIGDGRKMENEYLIYREEVSKKGVEILSSLLSYLVGKKLEDL